MADPDIDAVLALIASRPRATEIERRRKDIDARGGQFAIPTDVQIEKLVAGGVSAEWMVPTDGDPGYAMLYLHGGGYVIGSLDSHRLLVAEIARRSGIRTLAIDYRLGPEHPSSRRLDHDCSFRWPSSHRHRSRGRPRAVARDVAGVPRR